MKVLINFINRYFFSIIAVLSVIILSGCTCLTGKNKYFYGIPQGASPHAFVIDISGSMGNGAGDTVQSNFAKKAINEVRKTTGSLNTGNSVVDSFVGNGLKGIFGRVQAQTTKLAEAQREIIPFLRGFSDNSYFNITVFNSNFNQFMQDFVPANQAYIDKANEFVKSLNANGGSSMLPALNAVLEKRPATIYLISDGQPSDSERLILQMANNARSKGVIINTIGVGEDQNKDLLRKIAYTTGGIFSPQGLWISIASEIMKHKR